MTGEEVAAVSGLAEQLPVVAAVVVVGVLVALMNERQEKRHATERAEESEKERISRGEQQKNQNEAFQKWADAQNEQLVAAIQASTTACTATAESVRSLSERVIEANAADRARKAG